MAEFVRTRKAAAKVLSVTERQLGNWVKEPWFPAEALQRDERNRIIGWDVEAIAEARDAQGRKGSEDAAAAKKLKLEHGRERLEQERIKTLRMRREEEEAQGNILPRDEYELALREMIQLARDRLLSLPKELCRVVPKKLHRTLRDEGDKLVRRILSEFSRQLERGPRD